MNEIKQGQVWRYTGPSIGRNLKHTIVGLERGWSEGLQWTIIITWSQPIEHQEHGGYIWMGSVNAFLREFSQIT